MIPCWPQPALHFGHATFYAHGILLILGSLVGAVIFVSRAQTASLSKKKAVLLVFLLAPIAVLGSHVAFSLVDDPSSLLQPQGISSLGGLLACLPVLALFAFRDHRSGWRWFDAAAYAAVCGAVIARLGCFLAHDRIGLPTSFWLSVNCFGAPHYDLALLEVIFLAICVGLLIWLDRHGWSPTEGMMFATLAVSYGLFRLMLGQLREPPQRYLGLIPEQWEAAILVAVGAGSWFIIKRHAKRRSASFCSS